MIIYNGKIAHPLRRNSIKLGDKTIFQRPEKAERSWLIIDLALPGLIFAPKDAGGMRTADGLILQNHGRRK